jgi:hypothetical protein
VHHYVPETVHPEGERSETSRGHAPLVDQD